ncbi:MAG: hypothetical protein GXZ03_11240 [Proteiniphilum sp.]|nr:hypothetical protein [Proteiniphilum sp.]
MSKRFFWDPRRTESSLKKFSDLLSVRKIAYKSFQSYFPHGKWPEKVFRVTFRTESRVKKVFRLTFRTENRLKKFSEYSKRWFLKSKKALIFSMP